MINQQLADQRFTLQIACERAPSFDLPTKCGRSAIPAPALSCDCLGGLTVGPKRYSTAWKVLRQPACFRQMARVHFIKPDKDRFGSCLNPAPPFCLSVKPEPDWPQPLCNNVTILRSAQNAGRYPLHVVLDSHGSKLGRQINIEPWMLPAQFSKSRNKKVPRRRLGGAFSLKTSPTRLAPSPPPRPTFAAAVSISLAGLEKTGARPVLAANNRRDAARPAARQEIALTTSRGGRPSRDLPRGRARTADKLSWRASARKTRTFSQSSPVRFLTAIERR